MIETNFSNKIDEMMRRKKTDLYRIKRMFLFSVSSFIIPSMNVIPFTFTRWHFSHLHDAKQCESSQPFRSRSKSRCLDSRWHTEVAKLICFDRICVFRKHISLASYYRYQIKISRSTKLTFASWIFRCDKRLHCDRLIKLPHFSSSLNTSLSPSLHRSRCQVKHVDFIQWIITWI